MGQRGDEQVSSTLEMNAAVKEIEAFSLGFGLRTERKDTAKLFRDGVFFEFEASRGPFRGWLGGRAESRDCPHLQPGQALL